VRSAVLRFGGVVVYSFSLLFQGSTRPTYGGLSCVLAINTLSLCVSSTASSPGNVFKRVTVRESPRNWPTKVYCRYPPNPLELENYFPLPIAFENSHQMRKLVPEKLRSLRKIRDTPSAKASLSTRLGKTTTKNGHRDAQLFSVCIFAVMSFLPETPVHAHSCIAITRNFPFTEMS
jgi:hypothetical protein